VRLIICGTRGSTPAPGAAFVRYGGQTSCIAIAHDDGDPTLVLDAGTGLRNLTRYMDNRPFQGTILIGHLHWDHTHGLPFFRSGDQSDSRCRVLIPEQGDATAVMDRFMSPPHFPVTLAQLNGNWSLAGLDPGTHQLEGFEVLALEIPHKASRTFGYRVSDGSSSVAYLSDHAPANDDPGPDGLGIYHDAARALCEGVDLIIHDAQYTVAEYPARKNFGHATPEYAIGLANEVGAKAVLLFHHDPDRTDDEVDAILAASRNGGPVRVDAAVEGDVITLPRA
jgi:phosphoribosyl 1,2-cyclic phosphodiesterase